MSALVAVVAARLTFDAMAIVLFGGTCFLDWMAPKTIAASLVTPNAGLRFLPIVVCFAAALWLPLNAAAIAGNWGAGANAQFLRALALGTSGGHVWIARCILSLAAAGIFGLRVTRLRIFASGLLLSSLSLSGHTQLQSGPLMIVHMLNDAVHVLSGSIWLGSLILLPRCLDLLNHPELYQDARIALKRFSRVGHFAVATVIATGITNSVLTLAHWPTPPISPYVALLGLKIALVGTMASLAVINRYLFVPRIRFDRTGAINQIKIGTWSEVVLGTGALALVAAFGAFDPH